MAAAVCSRYRSGVTPPVIRQHVIAYICINGILTLLHSSPSANHTRETVRINTTTIPTTYILNAVSREAEVPRFDLGAVSHSKFLRVQGLIMLNLLPFN